MFRYTVSSGIQSPLISTRFQQLIRVNRYVKCLFYSVSYNWPNRLLLLTAGKSGNRWFYWVCRTFEENLLSSIYQYANEVTGTTDWNEVSRGFRYLPFSDRVQVKDRCTKALGWSTLSTIIRDSNECSGIQSPPVYSLHSFRLDSNS